MILLLSLLVLIYKLSKDNLIECNKHLVLKEQELKLFQLLVRQLNNKHKMKLMQLTKVYNNMLVYLVLQLLRRL